MANMLVTPTFAVQFGERTYSNAFATERPAKRTRTGCPRCGAPPSRGESCDYCGSLSESQ